MRAADIKRLGIIYRTSHCFREPSKIVVHNYHLKMLRYAVLLGLVAFCVAHRGVDHCCSSEDRRIVQKQWNALFGDVRSSRVKIALGSKLLLKLAELRPDAKEALKPIHIDDPTSGEFQAHSFRVLNSLDVFINLLTDAEALDAALDHHSKEHSGIAHIKKEHFKVFGEILISSLPKVLDDFDAFSWRSCYKYIGQRLTAQLHD